MTTQQNLPTKNQRTIRKLADTLDIQDGKPSVQKLPSQENVPVASYFLPQKQRELFLSFYNFLRLADDIADDPKQESCDKLEQLNKLETALCKGYAQENWLMPAVILHQNIEEAGLSQDHALNVMKALKIDANGIHCHSWEDVLHYCRFSADPVGRFLLSIFDEKEANFDASDALCTVLAILNFLQDLKNDWLLLGRLYIPAQWFEEERLSLETLISSQSLEAHIRIKQKALARCRLLLEQAQKLPSSIQNKNLRKQAYITLAMAEKLYQRIDQKDPLKGRISLSSLDKLSAFCKGLLKYFFS